MADRAIGGDDQVRHAARLIRRVRPRVIAIPYWDDRHPDHGAASRVLSEAVFSARLRRYQADGEPWQVEWTCYYFINDSVPASFVVDVSAHYELKRRALACYRSQFSTPSPASGAVATRLTSPRFMQLIESRDAQFGALAGVAFAEGVIVKEPTHEMVCSRQIVRVVRQNDPNVLNDPNDPNVPNDLYEDCHRLLCVGRGRARPQSWPSAWSIVATKSMSSKALIRRSDSENSGPAWSSIAWRRLRTRCFGSHASSVVVQRHRPAVARADVRSGPRTLCDSARDGCYLARQILSSTSGAHVLKIITTLHGTDITLLGSDRSHRRPWRFQSIGRTVSRRCLRA